ERDVDIVVEWLALHAAGLRALLGLASFLDHTDHPVIEGIDLDRVLKRIGGREEAPGKPGCEDTDVILVRLVDVAEEPSSDYGCSSHLGVEGQGANDLARCLISSEAGILADYPHGQHPHDTRDGGLKPGTVLVGQPVLELHAAPAAAPSAARLLAS